MPAATHREQTEAPRDSARAFWFGLLFWGAVCLAGVLLRGIRWEEGYERAQVLLGLTPYPDGHPHARWYWNAYSIHYYGSAALLWLTERAAWVCGIRQFLAAVAVHLPVFGLVWVLTRRALPAHFATVLSVVGAHAVFQSYMPISAWANKATSGMMGTGWAFWVLAALCAGRCRAAGLLFGLMPLVHIGQWPILLLTAGLWAVWQWRQGDRDSVGAFVRFAMAGLVCCALFAALQRPFLIAAPESGAYTSTRSGQEVWAEYVTYEDMHRAPVAWPRFGPMGNSVVAMAGFLLLAAPLAWRALRLEKGSGVLVLFVYALLCASAIGFAQVVHRNLGVDAPYLVVGWMPNRLTIHTGMLMLCGAAAWPFYGIDRRVPLAVLLAAAWLAALPLWPALLPEALVDRYFGLPELALFFAGGSALAALWRGAEMSRQFRAGWILALALGLATLAWYHQLAAAAVGLGVLLTAAEHRFLLADASGWRAGLVGALLVVALGAALFGEWQRREHLPVSAFEAEVRRYLAEHSERDDLVLTPLDEHLQMVLERGVVATFETRQHIGYMRSLAAAADKIYADLYGVRDGSWYDWDLWMNRSEASWQALGAAFGFRFVLSKEFHPLDLPERLRGDGLVLYEIPDAPR